jgi:small conductance mechanosensitive channel
MQDLLAKIDTETYVPIAIGYATNFLLAILILIVGFWIAGSVRKAIVKTGAKYKKLDNTLFRFLGSFVRYIILAFVLIAVLNRFGVQTASIIALLGAAGLAVGLALQGAMSNLAAGVMLLIFRPYKVGEKIEAAGTVGRVEEITLFTTILRTPDHLQIILPNGQIFGEKIINFDHHNVRGVDLLFGVSYDADIDQTRKVIESVLADNKFVLNDPAPFIGVEALNDSSVDFRVRPFTHADNYLDVVYTVTEELKKALDAAGISIPYPHRQIVMAKDD